MQACAWRAIKGTRDPEQFAKLWSHEAIVYFVANQRAGERAAHAAAACGAVGFWRGYVG
jgi:hypothetical protein